MHTHIHIYIHTHTHTHTHTQRETCKHPGNPASRRAPANHKLTISLWLPVRYPTLLSPVVTRPGAWELWRVQWSAQRTRDLPVRTHCAVVRHRKFRWEETCPAHRRGHRQLHQRWVLLLLMSAIKSHSLSLFKL
jgi:hypothetical protein